MLVVGRDKEALDCRLQPVKILHESPLIIKIIIINHKSDEKYTTYKPLHATNFQTKPRVLKNQAGKKILGQRLHLQTGLGENSSNLLHGDSNDHLHVLLVA